MRRRYRSNPLLAIVGNPPATAELVSRRVVMSTLTWDRYARSGRPFELMAEVLEQEVPKIRRKRKPRPQRDDVYLGTVARSVVMPRWVWEAAVSKTAKGHDPADLLVEVIKSRGPAKNPHESVVFNPRTSEVRVYPLPPHEATAAASWDDYPALVPTAELHGHVRTGDWCCHYARTNARDPMGKWWGRLLDSVAYGMTDLREQQGGMGIVSITRKQWLDRFAKGKSQGAQDKMWSDLQKWLDQQERKGYALRAIRRKGWLDLIANNVYDAAWMSQPGTIHQLGPERERELLGQQYEGAELAGLLAEREDFWDELLDEPEEAADWELAAPERAPPYLQALWAQEQERLAHQAAENQAQLAAEAAAVQASIAARPGRGQSTEELAAGLFAPFSPAARARNPQERTQPRPGETEHDLDEFEDHPGYYESWDIINGFHDADPARIVVFELEDGSDQETWEPVHAYLHDVIETNYKVPGWMEKSNKHQGAHPELYPGHSSQDPGLWTHKHFKGKRNRMKVDYPIEVRHPFRAQETRKILRGSDPGSAGWWES